MNRKKRKDAIETLVESYREGECDDAVCEARERYSEDGNYLDLERQERYRLQGLTDDDLKDELREMLATKFGCILKSLVDFLTNLTKEDSVELKAEIKRKFIELTQRLVGEALETEEVQ